MRQKGKKYLNLLLIVLICSIVSSCNSKKNSKGNNIDSLRQALLKRPPIATANYLCLSSTLANFKSQGGNVTINVAANQLWSMSCPDSWVNIQRDNNNNLLISCEENYGDARTAVIFIKAANVTKQILISQEENERARAVIKNVWITPYSKILRVHVAFSVVNMLNRTGSLVVYVVSQHSEENTIANTRQTGYRVYTFNCPYQQDDWSDYAFDLTTDEITYTVSNDSPYYKLYIKLFDDCDNLLATSNYASFSIE